MKTIISAKRLAVPLVKLPLILLVVILQPALLRAQAPGLLWSTNVGATLFAVDSETNAYASVGGKVILISPTGQALQTNTVCPRPGIARRDSVGNFYFTGSFDGTQDFGGITLVGGCANNGFGQWAPGYPSGYLAKYSGAGSLLWVVKFGGNCVVNEVGDLLLDAGGTCYLSYLPAGVATIARFDGTGSNVWSRTLDPACCGPFSSAVTLGGLTATNCAYIVYRQFNYAIGGRVDQAGNASALGQYPMGLVPGTNVVGRPVVDDFGNHFQVGECFDPISPCSGHLLRKFGSGTSILWSKVVSADAQWTLQRDVQANVYVAGTSGLLAKFDSDGAFIWSNNFARPTVSMVVDPSGNRFLSFADGGVARLADEPLPQAPAILANPKPLTLFVGDPVSLSVSATGTEPLRYFWRLNGTNIAGTTGSAYSLSNATVAQGGNYTVLVTNVANSVTSAPALVRVKSVQLYAGSQMMTNGTYVFAAPPTLSVRSAFAGGSSFYTLDGSTPSFASTFYSGPFTLNQSATVRALGYRADFLQSEEADAVTAIVLVNHILTASSSGGGSVALNPPGGVYNSTNTVIATAIPAAGYGLMYWLGDASGSSSSVNISMESDKSVRAVFGTTLSTTVAGNGAVQLAPPGGLYPQGSIVQLTAVPAAGNYFGFWGNAATGNTNPLYFTINAPTQTVSSIFAAIPGGQAALTVLVSGRGQVNMNPRANVHALNAAVTLTAVPDRGQEFLNWSGDASGTQNPLSVPMTGAKVITAHFSARPELRSTLPGAEGFGAHGFRFTLVGDPATAWEVFCSSNLVTWESLAWITNDLGEVQFTDPGAANHSRRFYRTEQ